MPRWSVRWWKATRPWGPWKEPTGPWGDVTYNEARDRDESWRLETDDPLISWRTRQCRICCKFRADGRTPHEVLRNNSDRGGPACFGEIVWVRVPGTRLLRGKFEVNWLELVWLAKTGPRKSTGAATSTGCASSGQSDDSPSQQIEEREYVDKPAGDPFNPKPKTSVGSGGFPVDLHRSKRQC